MEAEKKVVEEEVVEEEPLPGWPPIQAVAAGVLYLLTPLASLVGSNIFVLLCLGLSWAVVLALGYLAWVGFLVQYVESPWLGGVTPIALCLLVALVFSWLWDARRWSFWVATSTILTLALLGICYAGDRQIDLFEKVLVGAIFMSGTFLLPLAIRQHQRVTRQHTQKIVPPRA